MLDRSPAPWSRWMPAAPPCSEAPHRRRTPGYGGPMHGPARWFVVVAMLAAGACSSAQSNAAGQGATTSTSTQLTAGRPFAVTVRHEQFVDSSRPTASAASAAYAPRRVLPTDLYIPTARAPRPLVMFSH